jgi:DNA-binding XRE family transcriptional regulator
MTTALRAALTSAPRLAKPEARLSNRIRVARAERDLSQEQLARAAGVSRQTISSIETGQYCPSALLAFRLAGVLAVRVDDLFWIEGEG